MISEFPLFMFTTLGGIAAGAYGMSAVFPEAKEGKKVWLFPLMCLLLLAVGAAFLPSHLGHPERILNALTHPGSMIAQEAYWSAAFGIIVFVDLAICWAKGSAPRALRIVGAVFGLGLIIVMSLAYYTLAGVPAWASWQTFFVFVLGDIALGMLLLPLFKGELLEDGAFSITALAAYVLAAVAFAIEASHFSAIGSGIGLLVAGAVLVAIAICPLFMARSGRLPAKTASWVIAVVALVGVVLARYGFYAAYAL